MQDEIFLGKEVVDLIKNESLLDSKKNSRRGKEYTFFGTFFWHVIR